jgi:hypothetical protein
MNFCGKYELVKITDQVESYAKWMNAIYEGRLKHE